MTEIARIVALDGPSNFRDLGGYRGHEGRSLKWRRLFRSDHLDGLSEADGDRLHALGITRVIDLRGECERAASAVRIPGARYYALPIEPTVVQEVARILQSGCDLSASQAEGLMQEAYEGFVHNNQAQFKALFELLLKDEGPLVFHCTAGKDRTGFAAALTLQALGVDAEVVMADYLLTNSYYRIPENAYQSFDPFIVRQLWQVHPGFLQSGHRAASERFGTVNAYLHRALGLGEDELLRLRAIYLDPITCSTPSTDNS
jgi:protein-tyrosine phosphatase